MHLACTYLCKLLHYIYHLHQYSYHEHECKLCILCSKVSIVGTFIIQIGPNQLSNIDGSESGYFMPNEVLSTLSGASHQKMSYYPDLPTSSWVLEPIPSVLPQQMILRNPNNNKCNRVSKKTYDASKMLEVPQLNIKYIGTYHIQDHLLICHVIFTTYHIKLFRNKKFVLDQMLQ